MMLKIETGAGWQWFDGVKRAETFGFVANVNADHVDTKAMYFANLVDLLDSVERMWGTGDTRSFDYEVWPTFAQGQEPTMVTSAVLTFDDRTQVLALLAGGVDAFLLSEKGDTIERLCG